ncbi:hypothetical protein DL95DRAFT_149980 [Leptodontidium sp. 2 PMI_412]|nr:hypothetical protein DL95DRAFT_149980 [Leptodontidium sp. 2 PMI_412]
MLWLVCDAVSPFGQLFPKACVRPLLKPRHSTALGLTCCHGLNCETKFSFLRLMSRSTRTSCGMTWSSLMLLGVAMVPPLSSGESHGITQLGGQHWLPAQMGLDLERLSRYTRSHKLLSA